MRTGAQLVFAAFAAFATFALCLAGLASTARAADPAGTEVIVLHVGESVPVRSMPGSSVRCDDSTVVRSSLVSGVRVLRAIGPGSTLCSVWVANVQPAGLYRLNVLEAAPADRDGGMPWPDGGPP